MTSIHPLSSWSESSRNGRSARRVPLDGTDRSHPSRAREPHSRRPAHTVAPVHEGDVDEIVARFEGRGVGSDELRRVAVAALVAARAALTGADFDRYGIVRVVGALKGRVREGGWCPPLPPEVRAEIEARPPPERPSASLRVEGLANPPS